MTTLPQGSDGSSPSTRAEHPGQAAVPPGSGAGPPGPAETPAGRGGAPAGRAGRAWLAWRQWRHTRPFWGGMLIVLGGAEILLSEKAPLPVIVHVGLQGLAGYLIPAVMVLCGLLLLFHPVQQTFYSLLAILLALGSWVTSNMGGFFIGMLLGVVGGALAFAWQRGQRGPAKRRRRPRPQREPSAGLALIRGDQPADTRPVQGGPPADTWPGGARHSSRPGETLRGATAILAIPLTPLVLSALASPAPHDRAASQSRPAISASPSTAPTTIASPAPRLSPTPGPTPSATPGPTPSLTPTPSPSAVPSPRPTRTHPRHVPAAGAPTARASTTPATLTAGSAVLAGLSFDGVAQVPTAAGPVPMLKFSMASLALSAGTKLLISQGGHVLLTAEAPSLELSGDVVLYTTEISGTLAGHQVTFTPKRPPSQLGHDVTLGSFVVHQPYASTGVLQASGYQVT